MTNGWITFDITVKTLINDLGYRPNLNSNYDKVINNILLKISCMQGPPVISSACIGIYRISLCGFIFEIICVQVNPR